MFTVGISNHQFFVGPRMTFDWMSGEKYNNAPDFMIDFGYRFTLNPDGRFKPYFQLSFEYLYNNFSYLSDYNYDPANPQTGIFANSFTLQTKGIGQQLNAYIGAGLEWKISKRFYLAADISWGVRLYQWKTEYSDFNTGESGGVFKKGLDFSNYSYRAGFGVGYRF